MSALAERTATGAVCPHCGGRLAADQEWCLECGAAVRVRVRAAPDWRVPVAIVVGVIALSAVGLVVALVALSNTANRSVLTTGAAAPAPAPAPKPAPSATTPATTTPASASTIATWPKGVTGFTVVLGVIPTKPAAEASAAKIAAAGIPVGVLYSSHYSTMRPGDWVVFSGTYSTRSEAVAATTQLQGKGQTQAYAFAVVPAAPGTTGATTQAAAPTTGTGAAGTTSP